jgi:glucose-1-phosphate cytidylyltransferase
MTGGRIRRIRDYVNGETFMLTYGDGVSNININDLLDFHRKNGKKATVTAVQPSAGRFGALGIKNEFNVEKFTEKPPLDGVWINGGYFVLEPGIFEYLGNDNTIWEREPLEKLAAGGNLIAFKHSGFWRPMDTLRDRMELEDMWSKGQAKWKTW